MRRLARTMVLLVTIGAAACRSAEAGPPAPPTVEPPTSADFARALADGSPFTVEFERLGLPSGASRALTIAADGTCEGSTREGWGDEPRRCSGRLSAADRSSVLAALRDAPFHVLDLTPEERVMDGWPVRIAATVGGRLREVERQMSDLRSAGLGPLCSTLDSVLEHLAQGDAPNSQLLRSRGP